MAKNTPPNYIVWGEIHFVATCGGGSNQFQGIGLVTSSLTTTQQKYRRLRGKIVSTVGNAFSFLNWRSWFGGSFPVNIHTLKEILLPKISTPLDPLHNFAQLMAEAIDVN